jgi:hypothetical protein
MEMLAELRVAGPLIGAGRVIRRLVLADRGRRVTAIDLTAGRSRYPFALSVPQSGTERLLLARLQQLGGSARCQHRVDTIEVDDTSSLSSSASAWPQPSLSTPSRSERCRAGRDG